MNDILIYRIRINAAPRRQYIIVDRDTSDKENEDEDNDQYGETNSRIQQDNYLESIDYDRNRGNIQALVVARRDTPVLKGFRKNQQKKKKN